VRNVVRISTEDHTAWLEERRKSIGGSDAAALVGMNPWVTPYKLWADKTGRMAPAEDNEAMRQGRDLEEYVARRFTEKTGKKVRVYPELLRNPAYPFAHANIDRKVTGERAGLECKTTSSLNLKKFKDGEYPGNYYAQCVHYLAVTGFERWYLAVLVFGQDFFCYTVERDESEINALMDAEKAFWEKHVLADVPPPPDGLAPTEEAIKAVFPVASPKETVDLFGQESIVKDYLATKELIRLYEQENERRKQLFQTQLADAEAGSCGEYLISWKEQQRESFNRAAFMADHPELDLTPYLSKSTFRKFEIKEST